MNQLRVSVATYNQVVFPHPENGTSMLALERKATAWTNGRVNVRAQPFGGGVRILNPNSLTKLLGEIEFDSERSKQDSDFRILIPTSQWEEVKQYCLYHLDSLDDPELESSPDRELVEEFEETLHIALNRNQYTAQPMGFVIENHPAWTDNWYARGQFTVRIYRVFEVRILDLELCRIMLAVSQRYSDQDFGKLALKDLQSGGRGRANTILTLPREMVKESYLALTPEARYGKIEIESHTLDESVLAVLMDVEVPQYQRA